MESQTQDLDRWQVPAGNNKCTIRIQSLVIIRDNNPCFDESSLIVKIEDEAAGEFVSISNPEQTSPVKIDVDQWPVVRDAIDFMTQHCRSDKEIS